MQRLRTLFFYAKTSFGIALAIIITFSGAVGVFADTLPGTPASNDSTAIEASVSAKTLLEATASAKKLLAAEVKLLEKNAPGKTDVIFAIWNREDYSLRLYHGTKVGTQVTLREPASFTIKAISSASATAPYATSPNSNIVVGIISTTSTKVKVKKKTVTQYHRAVSVPFSSAFYTPDTYANGSDYLSDVIGSAYAELANANIQSRAFPGKPVTSIVDPYLIKAIIVSEHTSGKSLVHGDSEGTLENLLVRLAVDRGTTFNSSISTAGAAGLVQFIASTYKITVKNNPAYKLNPDFRAGMSDHKNAVKAEIALLDADLASLPASVRGQYAANNFQTVAALLGASYNGGSTRVQRALQFWGDSWMSAHTAEINALASEAATLKKKIPGLRAAVFASKTKAAEVKLQTELNNTRAKYNSITAKLTAAKNSTLRAETVDYITKIEKAYDMFSAGMYATPHAPSGALPTPVLATGLPTPPLAVAPTPLSTIANSSSNSACFPDGCLAMR